MRRWCHRVSRELVRLYSVCVCVDFFGFSMRMSRPPNETQTNENKYAMCLSYHFLFNFFFSSFHHSFLLPLVHIVSYLAYIIYTSIDRDDGFFFVFLFFSVGNRHGSAHRTVTFSLVVMAIINLLIFWSSWFLLGWRCSQYFHAFLFLLHKIQLFSFDRNMEPTKDEHLFQMTPSFTNTSICIKCKNPRNGSGKFRPNRNHLN